MPLKTKNRIAMIDWFKAIGIFLIVFGHLDGDLINMLTAPIRSKQLGVVFFIFIMGWQLAQEKRDIKIVLLNRLFKICFWGVASAACLSVIGLIFNHDINESNYLPFMFGINVILDYFPANPTSWYIGTYIHILFLWVFLGRKIIVSKKLILISFIIEILIRGFLMRYGLFRAYMIFFNWQTVFLIGMYLGQGEQKKYKSGNLLPPLICYIVFICLWSLGVRMLTLAPIFPFRLVLNSQGNTLFFITSILTSLIYIGHAILFYNVAKRLNPNAIIEFFSRNTLIIFLAHMPVWYLIAPYMSQFIPLHPLRLVADMAILFVGIGVFSSILENVVPWRKVKSFVEERI